MSSSAGAIVAVQCSPRSSVGSIDQCYEVPTAPVTPSKTVKSTAAQSRKCCPLRRAEAASISFDPELFDSMSHKLGLREKSISPIAVQEDSQPIFASTGMYSVGESLYIPPVFTEACADIIHNKETMRHQASLGHSTLPIRTRM